MPVDNITDECLNLLLRHLRRASRGAVAVLTPLGALGASPVIPSPIPCKEVSRLVVFPSLFIVLFITNSC
jgi:hypothetical protein